MKTRDFHLPGRSPVYAREGMAATSHPLASLAAIETLKAGGTAADAAVAAVAVLCVVEPAMTGIGGDCFCLVAKPDAAGVGLQRLRPRGGCRLDREAAGRRACARKIAATSPHAVTVPGAIDAWEAILKAHGRFGLDRALQPAIGYAENGFADRAARRLRLGRRTSTSSSHMRARAKYYLVERRSAARSAA